MFDVTRWDDGAAVKQGLTLSEADLIDAAQVELARRWGYDHVTIVRQP